MEKLSKHKKKIIYLVLSILIVLVIGFVALLSIVSKPYNKVKSSIDNIFKIGMYSIDSINKNTMYESVLDEKISIDGKINTNLNLNNNTLASIDSSASNIQNFLNDSQIYMKTKMDIKNKYINGNFTIKNNDETVDVETYVNNQRVYVLLKDLLNEYINVQVDGEKLNAMYSNIQEGARLKDIKGIIEVTKKSFDETKIDDKIKSTKVEMVINGSKSKLNKNTLVIDNEFLNRFYKAFYTNINENDDLKKALYKLKNDEFSSYESFQELISYKLQQLNEGKYELYFLNDEKYEYSVYTLGFFQENVRYEINYMYDDVVKNKYVVEQYKLDGYKYKVMLKEDTPYITKVLNINNLVGYVNLTDNCKIDIEIDDKVKLNMEGKLNLKQTDLYYLITKDSIDVINGNIKFSNEKQNDAIVTNLGFSFNTPDTGIGRGDISIETKTNVINTIQKPEFKEAIDFSNISPLQITQILYNLQMKSPNIVKKVSDILKIY